MAPAARAERSPTPARAETAAADAVPRFGDRLADRVASRRSQLVLGLDPDPGRLWPRAYELTELRDAPPAARAAFAVAVHCRLVIDAVAEYCVGVKLQVACFERLGAPGWAALQELVERAHERDLLVIADAKRGDVGLTAAAYAQAFFGSTPTPYGEVKGLSVDALTANPLLGSDSLAPLVSEARTAGGGLFVLARSSNPGAEDLQERPLKDDGTVSDRLAEIIAQLAADGVGDSGLSDVGAVVGATAPERLGSLRLRMPHSVFLLPGVGAQGGRVEDLAAAFEPGPAGGLVAASRAIVRAHERSGGEPTRAAREEAVRLRAVAWELSA